MRHLVYPQRDNVKNY